MDELFFDTLLGWDIKLFKHRRIFWWKLLRSFKYDRFQVCTINSCCKEIGIVSGELRFQCWCIELIVAIAVSTSSSQKFSFWMIASNLKIRRSCCCCRVGWRLWATLMARISFLSESSFCKSCRSWSNVVCPIKYDVIVFAIAIGAMCLSLRQLYTRANDN